MATLLVAVLYVLGVMLMRRRFRALVAVDLADEPGNPAAVPGSPRLVAALWPLAVLVLAAADVYLALSQSARRGFARAPAAAGSGREAASSRNL